MVRLDRKISFERKVEAEAPGGGDDFMGAGSATWQEVATVYAQVHDVRPARAENAGDSLNMANRPADITIRYRDDITSDMRIVYSSRVLQIISGPAEVGRRKWLEMRAEEYSTAGTAA